MAAHRDVRHRLEQFAANPTCKANMLSAVYDIPMGEVAKSHGASPKVGQSPFAIARGQTFEKSLFDTGSVRLRRALIDKKVLPENAAGFVDLRINKNAGPMVNLEASREAFRGLLGDMASGKLTSGTAPAIVAGPALVVPGKALLPDGLVAIDVVTIHPSPDGRTTLRVGEIKVYPDRGGYSDAAELATARAQAGLYVYALRVEIDGWQIHEKIRVADDGFLVLTRPGSNIPTVRPREDLTHQAARARDAYDALAAAAGAQTASAPLSEKSRLRVIDDAQKSYSSRCSSFCELADVCHDAALADGNGGALGEQVGKFLGSVSIHRAIALMHGGEPRDEFERELKEKLS